MSGSVVTVAAVAKGGAIVIVTATDPGGLSATQSFGVTVPNRAPAAGDPIPDIEVFVGDEAGVDASGHFTDPDGDALTFTGLHLGRRRGQGLGLGTVGDDQGGLQPEARRSTITARDPGGLTATQTASVTVTQSNRAARAVGTIHRLGRGDSPRFPWRATF